jgi:uncharacterized protein YecT (DUF1311 family)
MVFSTKLSVAVLLVVSASSMRTSGQSAPVQAGAAANREYSAVFAHSDSPCSASTDNASYNECMVDELGSVEAHLDAFVGDLRGVTGSPDELAGLNRTDATWRAYRESACSLPSKRFRGGTISAPMENDCRLTLDRAYMKQLSGTFILSQFPK